jgi:hypothetical protein
MIAAVTFDAPGMISRDALTREQCDEMYHLLDRYFEGVSRSQFESDLAQKNWVIDVRRDQRLVGFTTLRVVTSHFGRELITVIYSGDTIVAPEAWGTPALARAWIAGVNRIRQEHPERRCFWLLLTSGFRTYRFLPVFWREFYPRYDAATPENMRQLLGHLAVEGYGEYFDHTDGLVRFPRPQRLRSTLAAIPDGRCANPHIRFFLERNPGHARGDELACVTEISESNLTAAGRRMLPSPR